MVYLPAGDVSIHALARLFGNTTECYKFFWFKALFEEVLKQEGESVVLTYAEIVNHMICDAWYMVTEFHLSLGPSDTLEKLVLYIQSKEAFPSNVKRNELLYYLMETEDAFVHKTREALIRYVPYRLQSPFLLMKNKEEFFRKSQSVQIERINTYAEAIYFYSNFNGLKTTITIRPQWVSYFRKNGAVVKGWLEDCLIHYLQRRNPGVPGIIDKLEPPEKRDLKAVSDYYHTILDAGVELRDIYTGILLTKETSLSIDHFVPWSYVAHDELWNLNPTTQSVNSSKGNALPDWNTYFERLCRQEYASIEQIHESEVIHKAFEKCAKKNLNDMHIKERLYGQCQEFDVFANTLETIIKPVYTSALNCGFKDRWVYEG